MVGTGFQRRHVPQHEIQRHRAHRHVHIKNPAPGELVGEDAAQPWAYHRGNTEDRSEQALDAPALTWGKQKPQCGDGYRKDRATADTLKPTKGDQLPHAVRLPTERRTDQEDYHGDQ